MHTSVSQIVTGLISSLTLPKHRLGGSQVWYGLSKFARGGTDLEERMRSHPLVLNMGNGTVPTPGAFAEVRMFDMDGLPSLGKNGRGPCVQGGRLEVLTHQWAEMATKLETKTCTNYVQIFYDPKYTRGHYGLEPLPRRRAEIH